MPDRNHSEFGGAPGRIQPEPHRILDKSYEQHRLALSTNPVDPSDTAEKALAREREMEGNF